MLSLNMVDVYIALTLLLPLAVALSLPALLAILGRLRSRHGRRVAAQFASRATAPVTSRHVAPASRPAAEVLERDVA